MHKNLKKNLKKERKLMKKLLAKKNLVSDELNFRVVGNYTRA